MNLPPLLGLMLVVACVGSLQAQDRPPQPEPTVTYATLAPLLQARCVICHSGPQAAVGLQLDSLDSLLRGSARGPVVTAGDPAGSELIRRLTGQSQPRMPLTGPPFLSDIEIGRFERWIGQGLPPGTPATPAASTSTPSAALVQPRPAVPTWTHVAPIFATRCVKCHRDAGLLGPPPGGYRLNSYEAVLASDEQVRVVPGHPEASELVRRIHGLARPRMPFDGPPYLNDAEILLISDWIRHGARNSLGEPAPIPVGARLRLRGSPGQDGLLENLRSSGRRRDRLPGPQDDFELRGHIAPDGSIEVERLRRR